MHQHQGTAGRDEPQNLSAEEALIAAAKEDLSLFSDALHSSLTLFDEDVRRTAKEFQLYCWEVDRWREGKERPDDEVATIILDWLAARVEAHFKEEKQPAGMNQATWLQSNLPEQET